MKRADFQRVTGLMTELTNLEEATRQIGHKVEREIECDIWATDQIRLYLPKKELLIAIDKRLFEIRTQLAELGVV